MTPANFKCYLVTKAADGTLSGRLAQRPLDELPPGEVLIRVAYSSLNYKDALSASGHPGVNKVFPNIPGVDAAGMVAQSSTSEFAPGDKVLVTGFDMGSNRWGGWAEYVRVPRAWVVPLPEGLTLRESMMLGTAGLTAALCIHALRHHDVQPDSGEVVVTGATGGVGSLAVNILAWLGYGVVAVTGKREAHDYLRALGAREILGREAVDDHSDKPLLPRRWAGGVDTVGGNTLATIVRATQPGGCVTACGMVSGTDLPLSVYPFILRAVTLTGVDAAYCPSPLRRECWQRLATVWKPDRLESIAQFIELEELPEKIEAMLAGRIQGRLVVRIAGEREE